MGDRIAKIVLNHHRSWLRKTATDDLNLIAVVNEHNAREWVCLACNFDPPMSGEYLFTISAADDFPAKPPSRFVVHTPNGVFELKTGICISIGVYHPENYRAVLGMDGFANNAAALFMEFRNGKGKDVEGIGIKILPPDQQAAMAARSRRYNTKEEPELTGMIEEFIAAHPDFSSVRALLARRTGGVAGPAVATTQAAAAAPVAAAPRRG